MALDLLKDMHLINSLQAQGVDWCHYDESFRRGAQFNKYAFSTVDHTLVQEATHRCGGANKFPSRQGSHYPLQAPFSSPGNPAVREAKTKLSRFRVPTGYCLLHLADIPCNRSECRYIHTCPWCFGTHAAASCPQPVLRSGQRVGNAPGGHVSRAGVANPLPPPPPPPPPPL